MAVPRTILARVSTSVRCSGYGRQCPERYWRGPVQAFAAVDMAVPRTILARASTSVRCNGYGSVQDDIGEGQYKRSLQWIRQCPGRYWRGPVQAFAAMDMAVPRTILARASTSV